MFDQINTLPPAPPPPPPKRRLSQRIIVWLVMFSVRMVPHVMRFRAWLSSMRREWVIERRHSEFGSVWYYNGNNPSPYSAAKMALRFRRKKAERVAQSLKGTYPAHTFSVVNIKTVEQNRWRDE